MLNLRLRRSGAWLSALLVIVVSFHSGLGLMVWARTRINSLNIRLTRLAGHETQLRGDVEKLRIAHAALSAPDRVHRLARSQGLRYPRPGQVVRFPSGEGSAGAPK